VASDRLVVADCHDFAILYYHGADRHLAFQACALGLLQREAHEGLVAGVRCRWRGRVCNRSHSQFGSRFHSRFGSLHGIRHR